MKATEFYKEMAKVAEFCEGTNVQPWQCVKYNGSLLKHKEAPSLANPEGVAEYTFALGIVEDKPVFVGDELYCFLINQKFTVTGITKCRTAFAYKTIYYGRGFSSRNYCSWNSPKPKIMLEGEELKAGDVVYDKITNTKKTLKEISGNIILWDDDTYSFADSYGTLYTREVPLWVKIDRITAELKRNFKANPRYIKINGVKYEVPRTAKFSIEYTDSTFAENAMIIVDLLNVGLNQKE